MRAVLIGNAVLLLFVPPCLPAQSRLLQLQQQEPRLRYVVPSPGTMRVTLSANASANSSPAHRALILSSALPVSVRCGTYALSHAGSDYFRRVPIAFRKRTRAIPLFCCLSSYLCHANVPVFHG